MGKSTNIAECLLRILVPVELAGGPLQWESRYGPVRGRGTSQPPRRARPGWYRGTNGMVPSEMLGWWARADISVSAATSPRPVSKLANGAPATARRYKPNSHNPRLPHSRDTLRNQTSSAADDPYRNTASSPTGEPGARCNRNGMTSSTPGGGGPSFRTGPWLHFTLKSANPAAGLTPSHLRPSISPGLGAPLWESGAGGRAPTRSSPRVPVSSLRLPRCDTS